MEDDLPTDVSETTESAAPPPAVAVAAGTSGSASSEGHQAAAAAAATDAAGGVNAKACPPQEGGPSSLEADDAAAAAKAAELFGEDEIDDPLLSQQPSSKVRDGDFVLLHFADGKQIFAHCVSSWRGKSPPRPSSSTVPYGNPMRLAVGYDRLAILTGGLLPLQLDTQCAKICFPSAKWRRTKSPSRTFEEAC